MKGDSPHKQFNVHRVVGLKCICGGESTKDESLVGHSVAIAPTLQESLDSEESEIASW